MRYLLAGVAAAMVLSSSGAIAQEEAKMAVDFEKVEFDGARLDAVLANQDDAAKARYKYRHPRETLEFFGIKPGMTVVELIPGGGWYTKILLPYLGKEGKVIAAGYSDGILKHFAGGKPTETNWNRQYAFTSNFKTNAEDWSDEDSAEPKGFLHGELPTDFQGTADAVLASRGLHHLNRFDVAEFKMALADYMAILKPGGIVGVIQHEAPENADDKWANGDNGYLKKSLVIKRFTDAGFEFVGETDVNENPKDKPTVEDGVWRLPPTLATSQDDEALKKKMVALGESNRMTLLFRKPK
ncbi:MAG: methyltransferase [Sphingomonadales bacterium]|jgi:predicted methyltransferase